MVNKLHKEDVTLDVSVQPRKNYSYVIFEWKRWGLLTSKQLMKGTTMVETLQLKDVVTNLHQGIILSKLFNP